MFKDTLAKIFKVDSLLSNLTGYVETRVELLKVEVKEDLGKGLAQGVAYLFIAFVFALFITFISIGIAVLLGRALGMVAGFSIVAFIYLVCGLILWFSREKLIARLEDRFSVMFRKKK